MDIGPGAACKCHFSELPVLTHISALRSGSRKSTIFDSPQTQSQRSLARRFLAFSSTLSDQASIAAQPGLIPLARLSARARAAVIPPSAIGRASDSRASRSHIARPSTAAPGCDRVGWSGEMKTAPAPALRARRASRAPWTGIVSNRPSRCACPARFTSRWRRWTPSAPQRRAVAGCPASSTVSPRARAVRINRRSRRQRAPGARLSWRRTIPLPGGSSAASSAIPAAVRSSLNSHAFGNAFGDLGDRGWRGRIALSIGASRARATRGMEARR
jgi:hypothetical protein